MCKWVVLGVLLASTSIAVAEEPAGAAPPSNRPAPPADPAAPPAAPAGGPAAPPTAPTAPAAEAAAPPTAPAPDAVPPPATPADASAASSSQPPPPSAPSAAPAAVPPAYAPLPYAEPIRPPPPIETDRDPSGRPPLSGGRLVGEFAIGSLFAVGGTLGGAYLGYGIETANGCHGEWCGFGGILLGGLAGLTFVTPLGVYLVGNSAGETGSLGATIGCSVLGLLAGGGAAAMIQDEDVAPVLVFAGPVVGSMIGFNLTRRYVEKKPARAWAPVANVSHGTASFGVVGHF